MIIQKAFYKLGADSRIRNLLLSLLYAIAYDYIYCNFVNAFFSYTLDSSYSKLIGNTYYSYLFLASVPFFFYKGVRTIACAFSLFVYILAYVPIINSLFVYGFPDNLTYPFAFMFFFCMCLFFLTDTKYLFKHLFAANNKLLPFRLLEAVSIVCLFIVLSLNYSQLHFVNFFSQSDLLYDLRAENNIRFVYLLCWLRSAFLPVLVISYLRNHSYVKYSVIIFAYILIFMLDKQKATAVFPFLITTLYYIVDKFQNIFSSHFHSILILLLTIPSFLFVYYLSSNSFGLETMPILSGIFILLIMRSQCISGMELERYFDFFIVQQNPLTHYGHVNIIEALFKVYPYKESIGQTVSQTGGNANATFWLMDGVAAEGLWGILIISIVFVVFKSLMNSIDLRINKYLCICIMLNGIMTMLNVSLFTAINSSGFLVLLFIALFFDISQLSNVRD